MANLLYPPYTSHFDGNQVPSLMAVEGTLGTTDTSGTARPIPVSANPTTGAMYVQDLSSDATGATGFNGGTVSVGTSAVELTFTGVTQAIMVTADHNNGTMVYIGPSTVTQAGSDAIARLDPGESLSVDLNDASAALYAVAGTTAQKVYKVALT